MASKLIDKHAIRLSVDRQLLKRDGFRLVAVNKHFAEFDAWFLDKVIQQRCDTISERENDS